MTRVPHLRALLTQHLQRIGAITDPRIAAAFGSVPRHEFITHVEPEEAYEDRAIPVKQDGDTVLSSISQPAMIAQMLAMLDVRPNDRVLEIGTGSGYTAALLAELARPAAVTSVDIESDLVAAAQARFATQGINVHSIVDDSSQLAHVEGSFDRVLVTAKANDIASAWRAHLRDGGRLVVPLDLGLHGEAAFAFDRRGNVLYSDTAQPCVFLPLRQTSGDDAHVFFRAPRDVSLVNFAHATIVCAPLADATSDWLERYDVVVARAESVFGITYRDNAPA